MTNARQLLSDDLLHQVEEDARAQNRQLAEVVEEAVRLYLEDRSWTKLLGYGQRKAKELGMTEADIDRAIAESRAEHRGR